jgi:hypothetical protein
MASPYSSDTAQNDAEVVEQIKEHKELFERIAASELPISRDAQQALDILDAAE